MGPWTELVEEEMAQNESFPFHNYTFPSTTDQYYKFEILSYHGNGGGLQYLDVKGFSIVHFSQTNINPPPEGEGSAEVGESNGQVTGNLSVAELPEDLVFEHEPSSRFIAVDESGSYGINRTEL